MSFLEKIKSLVKPSPAKLVRERDRIKPFKGDYNDDGIFIYGADGFTIGLKDGPRLIQWAQLEKLTAYKIDLITFDEICLHVIYSDGKVTISESTHGWHKFVKTTKMVFPGIDKEWDAKIAYPSFATNLTVIYEKAPVKA